MDCTKLSGIWVASNNSQYFSDGKGVLFNKRKTTLICCPGGISGAYKIPDSVTSITQNAFSGCTSLTSVTIPDSVTSIGDYTFQGCAALTSVTLPDGVTNIEDGMFRNCASLTSFVIPDGVTSVDSLAFCGCTSLTRACFKGKPPEMGSCVFQVYDESSKKYVNLPDVTLYFTLYSIGGDGGWTTPTWRTEKYPTALWDGVNVPQPPHQHDYAAAVTAPTCTEQGYTTHTCVCGDSYIDSYTNALGHDYIDHEAKAATCTEIGWEAYRTCNRCDYTSYKEIPIKGHTSSAAVRENEVAATCTVDGSYDEVVYCSNCDAELSREAKKLDALGHDYVDHAAKAATCTEIGWEAYRTCKRCDYTTYKGIPTKGLLRQQRFTKMGLLLRAPWMAAMMKLSIVVAANNCNSAIV